MENYMNNTKKRKFIVYVLVSMLVTPETAHFERSLLNTGACLNAVQVIQLQEYKKEKRDRRTNTYVPKEEDNWK